MDDWCANITYWLSSTSAPVIHGMTICSGINVCFRWQRSCALTAMSPFIFLCFLVNGGNASGPGKFVPCKSIHVDCCPAAFLSRCHRSFWGKERLLWELLLGMFPEQMKPKCLGGSSWLVPSSLPCPFCSSVSGNEADGLALKNSLVKVKSQFPVTPAWGWLWSGSSQHIFVLVFLSWLWRKMRHLKWTEKTTGYWWDLGLGQCQTFLQSLTIFLPCSSLLLQLVLLAVVLAHAHSHTLGGQFFCKEEFDSRANVPFHRGCCS